MSFSVGRHPFARCLPAALALAACSREAKVTAPPLASALALAAGDAQSAPAGSLLAQPLVALASDGTGAPVPSAVVRFRVVRGTEAGSVLTDTIAVAGYDGTVSTRLRLGSALDTSVVEAFLPDRPTVIVRFRAIATPPPSLDAVEPATFASGDTVRLRGRFLDANPASKTAFFGSARGRIVSAADDTALTAVVPPCLPAGSVGVRLRVGTATTNAVSATFAGPSKVLSLQPLEGTTVSAADLSSCLQLAGGGATYLLVPQSAAAATGTRAVIYTLAASGTTLDVTLGDRTTPQPIDVPSPRPDAAGPLQHRWDVMLREREAGLVADAITAGTLRPTPDVLAHTTVAAPPPVGSTRVFQVLSKFDGTTFRRVSARLRYAGNHILLYVDTDELPGAFTDADLASFGALFDRTLYDIDVRAFGSESDIDANGRVIMLLTPVVNALTSPSECQASGFITGFHYGVDLLASQSNSNRGEIFYGLVPDVGGTRSCEHTKADVERLVPATFVHEFQHMISFGQHVLARGGPFEALWLNEGLSHIAEELGGKLYEARYPPPSGRTNPDQLFPDSAQGYLTPNMRNAQRYLEIPGATSAMPLSGTGSLAERGGSWLFLRWLGDQLGESIYAQLVQTGRTGITNVENRTGESFDALFGSFATALYTDSLPGVPRTSVPARLHFTTRNLRQIFKRFADIDQTGRTPTFPFTPVPMTAGQTMSGAVRPGAMAFYQLVTAPNEAAVAIRLAAGETGAFVADDHVQIGVFRLP